MTSLRVLTVNIHKGFTAFNRRFMLHDLREAVRTIGADVVFLQEVVGTHARHASTVANWPETPHYEFLADSLWPQFAYGRNAVYPQGDHGNAVLSKFPILRHENRDVSIAGPERRGLLHCVLSVPMAATPRPTRAGTTAADAAGSARSGSAQEVHAICVHLGLREAHRTRQLELLCHMVNDGMPREAPLVVAGDFNDWRQRADRQLERCAGLREVHASAHGHAARTFPSRFPMLSLDRIYVRNVRQPMPLALPRRPWSHLSDHAPLAAEIQL